MRYLFSLAFLCTVFLASGQKLTGSWIMAYVEAKQPIYTMVEIDGQYQMADDAPQDSSFVYGTGLMLIDFDKNETVSYSYEGEEKWTYKIDQDSIYLYSKKDTLYGNYEQNQFAVSSTLDDRPTIYYFKPLGFKAEFTELPNSAWAIKEENNFFNKKEFYFEEEAIETKVMTEGAKEDYTYYGLDNLNTVEYEVSYPLLESTFSEFGMIYLFKAGRKKLKGVYYPIIDDRKPVRKEIELRKIKN